MSMPKVPVQRTIERQGLRAAQAWFESRHHVFQEVSLQNDFGKDAYVDMTRAGVVTPICIALQVKAGDSYRRGDLHAVPVGTHGILWRDSTIPTFGLVYDPTLDALFWSDLTRELSGSASLPAHVTIPKDQRLDTADGEAGFHAAIARHAAEPTRDLAARLLSPDPSVQFDAVGDAFALGRRSAHALILLRRVVADLATEATRHAIYRLSHVGHHPDIFWNDDNWVPQSIADQLRATFQFSVNELAHLFSAVDVEEWDRGQLGQSLSVVVQHDVYLPRTAPLAIDQLVARGDEELARGLLACAATVSDDPRSLIEATRDRHPELWPELIQMWLEDLDQDGWVYPY